MCLPFYRSESALKAHLLSFSTLLFSFSMENTSYTFSRSCSDEILKVLPDGADTSGVVIRQQYHRRSHTPQCDFPLGSVVDGRVVVLKVMGEGPFMANRPWLLRDKHGNSILVVALPMIELQERQCNFLENDMLLINSQASAPTASAVPISVATPRQSHSDRLALRAVQSGVGGALVMPATSAE